MKICQVEGWMGFWNETDGTTDGSLKSFEPLGGTSQEEEDGDEMTPTHPTSSVFTRTQQLQLQLSILFSIGSDQLATCSISSPRQACQNSPTSQHASEETKNQAEERKKNTIRHKKENVVVIIIIVEKARRKKKENNTNKNAPLF